MGSSRRHIHRWVAIFVMMGLAPSAHAGVWFTSDLDVVGLGQAGAFVAAPSTVAAAWYNPAGLAAQRGFQVQLEAGAVHSPLTYDMADGTRVDNKSAWLPVGLVGLSYDCTVANLAIGAVAYVPQSNTYAFDVAGPQRFQSVANNNLLAFFHALAAYRFFNRVSIGVALGPTYLRASQISAVSAALFGDPAAPAWTVVVDTRVTAPIFLAGNVGVSAELASWLTVGASFMPGFDVTAHGSIQITLPDVLVPVTELSGSGVSVTLPLPHIFRAGARVKPANSVSIEVAFVLEGWSRLQTITVEPDVTVAVPVLGGTSLRLGKIAQKTNYSDIYSVRLGGEWQPLSWLTLRAGASIETSGSDPASFDLSAPEGLKIGLAAGASFKLWKLYVDLAYAHTFVPPVTVSASTVAIKNVLFPSNTAIVGNGVYSFSFDMFHLGLRLRLP